MGTVTPQEREQRLERLTDDLEAELAEWIAARETNENARAGRSLSGIAQIVMLMRELW